MTKQAIIYSRFSPRPNADECKSNEKQEVRCRAYCETRGFTVADVFSDEAVSGKTLHRPGLAAAIAALQPGMVLVIDTADRLARDMLVSLTIHHQIEQRGAQIEVADGSPSRTTPEGKLFANILAAFAQYERERFARRTKAGLAKKKASGQWLGRPPIGWQIDGNGSKRLVEHPVEQVAITHARKCAANGLPSDAIAKWLTEAFGPCRGKPWSGRTVRKILARKAAE